MQRKTGEQVSLFIKDADTMTKRQRQKIETWLKLQGKYLRKDGDDYYKHYKAHYTPEK